nr:hypothetical protein [Tanacetum cinerariifolium]
LILKEMINQDIEDSKAYKTYLNFATRKATPKKARKFKKVASPSKKLSPVLEEEPEEKPKRAKKPSKKSTTAPTTCFVIRDTSGVYVPTKKAPTKADRGKGMDLLSKAALLEAAQLKKTLGKSRDSDDDKNNDESDDASNDDDDDVNSDAGDEDEEYEEEYVRTLDSYGFTNDEEEYEELYKDVNTTYEQVKDDEHVILTTIHDTQKTKDPLQSYSVSSDFENQFLNLDNVPPTDSEVVSMMNVKSFCLGKRAFSIQQADYSAQLLEKIKSQISTMVDAQLSTTLKDSIKNFLEEPVFEVTDIEMPLNQGDDVGNTNDQPNVDAASKDDWKFFGLSGS